MKGLGLVIQYLIIFISVYGTLAAGMRGFRGGGERGAASRVGGGGSRRVGYDLFWPRGWPSTWPKKKYWLAEKSQPTRWTKTPLVINWPPVEVGKLLYTPVQSVSVTSD